VTALTCLCPNRQVFVLLDVQHDLQAVPRAAFQRGQQRVAVFSGVERVAFPVARVNLQGVGGGRSTAETGEHLTRSHGPSPPQYAHLFSRCITCQPVIVQDS